MYMYLRDRIASRSGYSSYATSKYRLSRDALSTMYDVCWAHFLCNVRCGWRGLDALIYTSCSCVRTLTRIWVSEGDATAMASTSEIPGLLSPYRLRKDDRVGVAPERPE